MKYLVVFILSVFTLAVYGQEKFDRSKVSRSTYKIVRKIAKGNMVAGGAVGYAGVWTKQYGHFIALHKATVQELSELTNHRNAAVRCYAFWALSHRDSTRLLSIVLNHIHDTQAVFTQFGCMGSEEIVADFFIRIVTPLNVDAGCHKLNAAQFAVLDSALIFTPNNLEATSAALARVKPKESIYPRIREMVVKDSNQAALVTLAKYQKLQDIPLILNNIAPYSDEDEGRYYTYKAIALFPHPDFLPFLEKQMRTISKQKSRNRDEEELYKAIASYKNLESVRLFQTGLELNSSEGWHIDLKYFALSKHPDAIYDSLYWVFWQDYGRISLDVYKYLCRVNPEKALILTRIGLENLDELYKTCPGLAYYIKGPQNLLSNMLDTVWARDTALGLRLVRRDIAIASEHLFTALASKVMEVQDTSLIEPLFDRLEKERNPNTYLEIVEALITYQDAAINQRLLAAKQKDEWLYEDWGGTALNKLLDENGIR